LSIHNAALNFVHFHQLTQHIKTMPKHSKGWCWQCSWC